MMPQVKANNRKQLGPYHLPDSDCQITQEQKEIILGRMGVVAEIKTKKAWGILVGPTCTRQCKACFGQDEVNAVRLPYPVCSTSSVCSARLAPLTRYNTSDRRGLTLLRVFLSMMICCRSTGPLCGWLLMVGRTYVVYSPRSPAHQQPSRKLPWTPGRPATDTSVPPSPRPPQPGTTVTPKIYLPVHEIQRGHRSREVWGTRKRARRCP